MEKSIQPRPFVKLLLLAALLGLISAVITFAFIALVDGAASVVWETAAETTGLPIQVFTLLVCTLGGLLVGILVRIFGDHTGIFAEMMAEFGRSGRFDYRHAPGIVLQRINVERPTIAKPRNKVVFYPGGSPVPFAATLKTYNRPWSITAEVLIPQGGAEGVLLAQGGGTSGFTFFVKDHKLYFLYNWLARDKFWLKSSEVVPEGEVELRYEFEPTGKPDPAQGKGVPARGQLYINRKLVASIDMPYSILFMFGTQGLSCGYDAGDPAAPEEYSGEFRFTGTIKRVTIDLSGELIPDTEAEMKIAMRRQ